jgi:hypothetical protein
MPANTTSQLAAAYVQLARALNEPDADEAGAILEASDALANDPALAKLELLDDRQRYMPNGLDAATELGQALDLLLYAHYARAEGSESTAAELVLEAVFEGEHQGDPETMYSTAAISTAGYWLISSNGDATAAFNNLLDATPADQRPLGLLGTPLE